MLFINLPIGCKRQVPCLAEEGQDNATAVFLYHHIDSVWLQRNKYTALVEEVRQAGGEAISFSAMHVSGEQLNQLTGVAAILRFPLPDIEDQELDAEL